MKPRVPVGTALAVVAVALHVYGSFRYGYFRDELYFVACAHHLAWGYVDQPPFVAIAAWLSGPFGYALPALRLLPALAAGATVWLACALAREFGGSRSAETVAGLATMLLPANLFLGSTLTTTSFEPLTWTWILYLLARASRFTLIRNGAAQRYIYGAAAVAVFAFYAKYSILFLVAAVVIALLLTGSRDVVLQRAGLWSVAAAAVAVLPNVWWQAAHDWPIFEVLRNDVAGRHPYNSGFVFQTSDIAHNAILFAVEQFVFGNLFLVPIWLTGAIALLFHPRFAPVRFIGVTYLIAFPAAAALGAKVYYICGIYPALCAAGAVMLTSAKVGGPSAAALRAAIVVCIAGGVAFAPFAMPMLPAPALVALEGAIDIPAARANPPRLVQPLFAEEFGWPELARAVAQVYHAMPPAARAGTVIFADNYGDAGALDFYGARYGLPPVISGQNSYYLWSMDRAAGLQAQTVLAVGASQLEVLRASFRRVDLVATYQHPYRWSAEGPTPIYICRGPIAPFGQLWPRFRWFGA